MERRKLGRIDHESSVVTLGAFCIGVDSVDQAAADAAIERALEHGINHIDVAPSYGQALERLEPWMPRIRSDVFLGAKTAKRGKSEAWDDIRSTQRRLGVDEFDLFQLHSVASMEDLDAATASGGALEALIEMRGRGQTRYIGITGHGPHAARLQLEALRRFDFDTIMFPVSAAIYQDHAYRRDAEALLAEAGRRNVGVQTIKMLARGGWGARPRELATWYDPYRDQDDINAALWFVLSQPMHTAPSTGEITLLPKILHAAERFRPFTREEQEEIVRRQRPPLPEPRLAIPAAP